MDSSWNRGQESTRKTPKSRLGPETTLKQAETPKSVFSAIFHPKSAPKIKWSEQPPYLYIYIYIY